MRAISKGVPALLLAPLLAFALVLASSADKAFADEQLASDDDPLAPSGYVVPVSGEQTTGEPKDAIDASSQVNGWVLAESGENGTADEAMLDAPVPEDSSAKNALDGDAGSVADANQVDAVAAQQAEAVESLDAIGSADAGLADAESVETGSVVVDALAADSRVAASPEGDNDADDTDVLAPDDISRAQDDDVKGVQAAVMGKWDVLSLKMKAEPVLGSTVHITPVTTGDDWGVAFRYTIEVNDGKDKTLLRRYKRGVKDLDFTLERSGTVVIKLEARDYKGNAKFLQHTLKVPTPVWSLSKLDPDYLDDGTTAFVPALTGDTSYLRYNYTWKSATGSGKSGTMGHTKQGSSEPFKATPGAYDISLNVIGTDGTQQSAGLSYLAGEMRGTYSLKVSQSGSTRGSSKITAKAAGKDEHGHALYFEYLLADDLGRTYAKGSGESATLAIPCAAGPFSVVLQPKAHGKALAIARKTISTPSVVSGMKMFMQNPELPTGCESVALGIALSGYGFNVSKTTIARSYLPYGNSFITTYVGDPWGAGAGIYAPGLVNTARAYLNAQGSQMQVHNLTGSSTRALYSYIDQGIPVVVWNTMGNAYPSNAGYGEYYNGTYYPWFYNEHCVVLAGYNANKTSVLIYDPLAGKVWRNANAFFRNYRVMGSMAMAIR